MRKEVTRKILCSWDDTIPDGLQERIRQRQGRRHFLKIAVVTPALFIAACDNANTISVSAIKETPLTGQAPWNTFSAVQNHLFPEDKESPGADDFNATGYLKSVLELPGTDDADKKFIRDGVNWINDLSRKMFKYDFHQLDKKNKEQVLQHIANSNAGEYWLSLLLLYLFEALLSDPVYGGNTNKIGWQWLEHIPGFPLPPENKRYYVLK